MPPVDTASVFSMRCSLRVALDVTETMVADSPR
jgi:hypothetical protein